MRRKSRIQNDSENKKVINQRMDKKKGKNDRIKILIKVLWFSLFLMVFLFSFFNLSKWGIYNYKSKKQIDDIVEKYYRKNNNEISVIEENNENPIDFEKLLKINSDIIAWIQIDNTSINYPIVQTNDNEYYLHKDIEKNYSSCGWIFMDFRNLDDFSDFNTVLYGHNIKSGIMFSDLIKIYNNKLGNDININIYTKKSKIVYKVYSSYLIEPEDEAINSSIISSEQNYKYVNKMLKRSSNLYNIVPTENDKTLTLSTCDYSGENRVLVHAVLATVENFD